MSEVIVLTNDVVLQDGMRSLHLMADAPIGEEWLARIPENAKIKVSQDEVRLHHLEASWRVRGDIVEFERKFACKPDCAVCHGRGCRWNRLVALWFMNSGERVSQAVVEAAVAYALATGRDPAYAWTRSMPKGVEYGQEIPIGGEAIVNLYSATWMPERAVAVGCGNDKQIASPKNGSQ